MDVLFMHLATVAAQELSSCFPCLRRMQSLYMHTLHYICTGLLIKICSRGSREKPSHSKCHHISQKSINEKKHEELS